MSSKKQTWANAHSQLWTSPAPRSVGPHTHSDVSSIASLNRDRSLLDDAEPYERANDVSTLSTSQMTANRPREKTLVQVSDILESYGTIVKESDIPAVLLNVVKELEQTKRENNFKDLLLREYADAVRRRFGLYGEDVPPSVAELSRRLREGATAKPAAGSAAVWLEEPLSELRRLLETEARSCFDEEIDFSLPMLLPDAAQTKSSISHVLQKCQEMLTKLSGEYRAARATVIDKLVQTSPSMKKPSSLSLTEALAELDARQQLAIGNMIDSELPDTEKRHTFKAALQSIIDAIPASLQIHFNLQMKDTPVLSLCSSLELLLKFLLSEYLSMERYMEQVEQQRQELVRVFHLPSFEFGGGSVDEKAQIDDALTHSMEALKTTVAAVVTFPHQISEEEIALRRASTEAVEELAQLLVDSRLTGSVAGASASHGSGCGTSVVRIEPPTRNLAEMVEMVKSRFAVLLAQQQRKELAGAQGRVGLAHMEEAMKNHGKQIVQQLREMCTMQDDGPGAEQAETLSELMGSLDVDRSLTPAKLDFFLSDVSERLRMVKTKCQRALSAAASNKTRADAAAQKCAAVQKKLHKVAACVERIGKEGLGLTFPAQFSSGTTDADDSAGRSGVAVEDEGNRGEGVSALRRLNLRPTSDVAPHKSGTPSAGAAAMVAVSDSNVLEALQFLAARMCADDALRDQLKVREELEQLRSSEARWKADTAAFHEAMSMFMHRLAANGQLVKQSLFMMGTDESAKDDLVEEVLQRDEGKANGEDAEAEYVERSLAELLQKYTRWAQRLHQTTEDHLYTQRKIVKYFAAVRRFFTSQQQQGREAAPPEDIPDDNLYDIDSCLMRIADVILPALDAAIQGVEGRSVAAENTSSSLPPPSSSPSGAAALEGQTARRQDAITQLVKDSAAAAAGGVLPYDHRIARLYETVARLYTAVTSLLQVHYLCIPIAVKRRSTGDIELIFDGDTAEDGFVDIDLERLIRVSQCHSGKDGDDAVAERFTREGATTTGTRGAMAVDTTAPLPPSTVAANNDVILRVTYQNMEVLQDRLKRFSANHKMAAIVLQKDMDVIQQQLAAMLEKYSEVDMETAFHQSRDELHELYVTLRDRAQVQKGCYFFNRVNGEGGCTWVTALEQLGDGFRGVVDRLVRRTAQATECRELIDEVVDMCAMYVNWAEHHPLPPSHALPPELLALCLRDGKEASPAADGNDVAQTSSSASSPLPLPSAGTAAKTAQRPPKPSGTPSLTPRDSIKQQQQQESQEAPATVGEAANEAKVSCFIEDRAVLKVIEHMFRLAQQAVEKTDAPAPVTDAAATQAAEARAHQLTEELALLREAVTVAEHHVDELTEAKLTVERQRDQAQSEAAVARAELRRWKRQRHQREEAAQAGPQQMLDVSRGRAAAGTSPDHMPKPSSASDAGAGEAPQQTVGMDEATVREVMAYMKLLSEELQTAKQRAGAAATPGKHHQHQWRQRQQPEEYESLASEREDDLVSSPFAAELDYEGEEAPYTLPDNGHTLLPQQQQPPNRYAALAEELRHRYGTAALSPMVVVDPHAHYSVTRTPTPGQPRYSPVKFRGPAYDACDRYYTRELGDGEGERGAERMQRLGGGGGRNTGVPPSTSRLTHARESRRRAAKSAFASAAATPHRYPRSLTRDEPLRGLAAGVDAPPSLPRVYQAPQRATPVTGPPRRSPSASSTSRRRSVAEEDEGDERPEEAESQETFYDDAGLWVPSQAHHRHPSASSVRRRPASVRSASLSLSRRPDVHHPGTNLAAAMRQIEVATQRGRPTPTRRNTRPRDGGPASELPASTNANLRSTALRRLAEVVSRTKVTPPRETRF